MSEKIALLSNPKSERNKKGMAEIDALAEADPDIIHIHLSPDHWLDEALERLEGERIGLWVCNSGDGTVQGLLTRLLAGPRRWPIPYFAIVPRGMANMTAADCGLRRRSAKHVQQMISTWRAGELDRYVAKRRVLTVDYRDNHLPVCGMFFGAAGISDAIKLCTGTVHGKGFKGEWSHAVTLASILWSAATKGLEAAGIHGRHVRLRIDRGEPLDEHLLVLLCTTLDHLVLRSRPFWNTGNAPVRFTRITAPAKGLVSNAWRVLYGKEPRRLSETRYRSCGAKQVDLWLDEPFTIDGEFFEPLSSRPVRISAPNSVPFVRF